MATGFLSPSATNTQGMTYEAMLYCKTNIAGYFFDGFMKVNAKTQLQITENPVETGASVVDHAYVMPAQIDMTVNMSDVHASLVSGQFEGGWSRSIKAYDVLREIQNSRIPVSVLCRFGMFENMLIQSMEASDSKETYNGLSVDVSLVEIPIARVKTVAISAASQTTLKTEMAKIAAIETTSKEDVSALYASDGWKGLAMSLFQ